VRQAALVDGVRARQVPRERVAAAAGRPARRGRRLLPDDAAAAAAFDRLRLRLRSAIAVPVCARGRVLGSLTLYTQHSNGRRYSARDVHLAADLAGRAGLAVDNARLNETEHAAVITLQHSLCPPFPRSTDCSWRRATSSASTATRWAATGTTCSRCPTARSASRWATSSGTTCGQPPQWGRLRGVVCSYAWDGGGPGSVLDRCDQLVQGLEMAPWPPRSMPASSLRPPTAPGWSATPTRAIRPRSCSLPTVISCASTSNVRR
jgi:hypothetical protein